MYDGLFSTESCVTLVYSELDAYSEPCHDGNNYDGKVYSQPCVTLVYLEPWYIQNPSIFRILSKSNKKYFIQNLV